MPTGKPSSNRTSGKGWERSPNAVYDFDLSAKDIERAFREIERRVYDGCSWDNARDIVMSSMLSQIEARVLELQRRKAAAYVGASFQYNPSRE